MNPSDKVELRKFMRNKRRSLSASEQATAAAGLLQQLTAIPGISESRRIALYLVNDGEIDPVEMMKWCWDSGIKTYVPVLFQEQINSLRFAEIHAASRLRENQYGIREPVVEAGQLQLARQLDLVLMPLVAFDQYGNRLGMGGGFYDTTFEFIRKEEVSRPVLIGIAHELQKVDRIMSESWDIPLERVVTDKSVYCLGKG